MKKLFALVLALCIMIPSSSYAANKPEEYAAWIQKFVDEFTAHVAGTPDEQKMAAYDEPIKLTSWTRYNSALDSMMPELYEDYGETYDNNRFSDVFKALFNIDVEYLWHSLDNDYTQQVRLAMAAGELPDFFVVTEQSDIVELAEAGVIMNLTDLIDQYAASWNIEYWNADGGRSLEMASYEDNVYGMAIMGACTDELSWLWMRQDWLDALGLSEPTTMEELRACIDAFCAADFDGNGVDDTIGMAVDSGLWYASRGLFSGFGAYPQYWVEKNGDLEWGGVSEENKAALQFMTDLYADGRMDVEWVVSSKDRFQSVIDGKCGVFYGGFWEAGRCEDCCDLDPNAKWVSVELPTLTGVPAMSPVKVHNYGWICINADCKNPEAVFKLAASTIYSYINANLAGFYAEAGSAGGSIGWLSPIYTGMYPTITIDAVNQMVYAYETGDASQLTAFGKMYYVMYQEEVETGVGIYYHLMFGPEDNSAMWELKRIADENRYFYDGYYGARSEFMNERWSTVLSEQLIAYTKIINGEVGVDEGFDAWVANFNALGGDRITAEVNEWYHNR